MTKTLTENEKAMRKVLRNSGYHFEQVKIPSYQSFKAPSLRLVIAYLKAKS